MMRFLQRWLPRPWRRLPKLPVQLWQTTLSELPFLAQLTAEEQKRLQTLCGHFLIEKQFHGAHGLNITDAMVLAIATQACLPLVHLPGPGLSKVALSPLRSLDWYDDFVGIVVQPSTAIAQRKTTDAAGVVHHYREHLAGEAMQGGPVMLSWAEIQRAPDAAERGSNVVIHEFIHKMDMRGTSTGEPADGAPDWTNACLSALGGASARAHWQATMASAYARFKEALAMAERFGGERPWLDPYGATHPAEFFAVTCEAYFVSRHRFSSEFPELVNLYDGFFRQTDSYHTSN